VPSTDIIEKRYIDRRLVAVTVAGSVACGGRKPARDAAPDSLSDCTSPAAILGLIVSSSLTGNRFLQHGRFALGHLDDGSWPIPPFRAAGLKDRNVPDPVILGERRLPRSSNSCRSVTGKRPDIVLRPAMARNCLLATAGGTPGAVSRALPHCLDKRAHRWHRGTAGVIDKAYRHRWRSVFGQHTHEAPGGNGL